MKRKPRTIYTNTQKVVMWDRWQKGESLHSIAQLFDRTRQSVHTFTESEACRLIKIKEITAGVPPWISFYRPEGWVKWRLGSESNPDSPHHAANRYTHSPNPKRVV